MWFTHGTSTTNSLLPINIFGCCNCNPFSQAAPITVYWLDVFWYLMVSCNTSTELYVQYLGIYDFILYFIRSYGPSIHLSWLCPLCHSLLRPKPPCPWQPKTTVIVEFRPLPNTCLESSFIYKISVLQRHILIRPKPPRPRLPDLSGSICSFSFLCLPGTFPGIPSAAPVPFLCFFVSFDSLMGFMFRAIVTTFSKRGHFPQMNFVFGGRVVVGAQVRCSYCMDSSWLVFDSRLIWGDGVP